MAKLVGFVLGFWLALPLAATGAEPRCGDGIWLSSHPQAQNGQARKFHQALSDYRSVLLALYPEISASQYESMSRLAFAIMGAETKYYQSGWYVLKSWTPAPALKLLKCLRRGVCGHAQPLSSGPTQIKQIPARVQLEFGVTPDTLATNPAHAAIATMAFLFELRSYVLTLKERPESGSLVALDEHNLNDYLAYFYQGKGRRILAGEVPDTKKNGYLAAVRSHLASIRVTAQACPVQVAAPNWLGEGYAAEAVN